MNKYDITVKELRSMIEKKGIVLPKKYIKKEELINILKNILSVPKKKEKSDSVEYSSKKKIRRIKFNPKVDVRII